MFGLIFADLIAVPADNTPSSNFPRGVFGVRALFPHNPSSSHFTIIRDKDFLQASSIHPHHFFLLRLEISCEELCAAASDEFSSNNFTAPAPQPIAISVLFFPCATQSPAVGSLPCTDSESEEVASSQVVLGINSEMMSRANLTLEDIIGMQHSAKTSSSSVNISKHIVKSEMGGSSSSAGSSDDSSSSSSSSSSKTFDNSHSLLPMDPRRSRAGFTSHRCTQLQHAHSSGPGSAAPHRTLAPNTALNQDIRPCPLAIPLGRLRDFCVRLAVFASLRTCVGRAADSFITAILR